MEEGLVSRIKQPALYFTSVPKCQNNLSLKYYWFVLIASILTVSIQWRIQVPFGARLSSGIQKSLVAQIASFSQDLISLKNSGDRKEACTVILVSDASLYCVFT